MEFLDLNSAERVDINLTSNIVHSEEKEKKEKITNPRSFSTNKIANPPNSHTIAIFTTTKL